MKTQDPKASTPKIYKIDIKKYEIIKEIKEGDFESVFSIRDKSTHKSYSATTIYSSKESDDYKQIIIREIKIMLEIQHPTLINYIGYSLKDFEDKKNVTILMEHFKNISLSYIIKKIRTKPDEIDFDNTDRQITLIGIARGMMFLHQNHILHRDLNPSNIFFDEECEPHIIGHGLSKIHLNSHNKKTIKQCAPTIYMAPETIKDNIYDTKTDVYSFGILMYEVITNQIPFPELQSSEVTEKQIKTAIIERDIHPTFSVDIKKPIKDLIERCWSKNPAERPTFEELYCKLSFSEWEVDVEDENEDEDENENEYKVTYFLDDVYKKRVFRYVDKIKDENTRQLRDLLEENSQLKTRVDEQEEEIENMKKEIEQLKNLGAEKIANDGGNEIQSMKKEIEMLKSQNTSSEKDEEIDKMKKEIEQLKKLRVEQNKSSEKDEEIEKMKKEIEQLKKLRVEQNKNSEKDEEIEKMKKEIEQLKKLQISQTNNNKKDDEIESMKKEIKQLRKLQITQKSQDTDNNNNNSNNGNNDADVDIDEISKLRKELAEQQKVSNALVQHVKKMKSTFKEITCKYDLITNEHKNHIQILAKELKALKATAKQAKSANEENDEQEEKTDDSSGRSDGKETKQKPNKDHR